MYPNLVHLPEWLPVLGGAPITSFGVMMLAAFLVGGYVLKNGMVRQGQTADPYQQHAQRRSGQAWFGRAVALSHYATPLAHDT